MLISKPLSALIQDFSSLINSFKLVCFSISNIRSLLSISFNRSIMISLLFIRITPFELIGARRAHACIYREYAGRRYTLSQCGLRILSARLHFQRIMGGCRI